MSLSAQLALQYEAWPMHVLTQWLAYCETSGCPVLPGGSSLICITRCIAPTLTTQLWEPAGLEGAGCSKASCALERLGALV